MNPLEKLQFPVLLFFLAASALAQESIPAFSSPPPSSPAPAIFISPSPAPAVSPSPAVSPTPSLLKKTGVKIQFLPPPMEGTISLGIYDSTGKLVRTLHRAATGDEFVAALDGYITHWDGLDDAGKPLPPGRYKARGYLVGAVTVRSIPMPSALASGSSSGTPAAALPGASPQMSGSFGVIAPGEPVPGLYFPNGKPFIYQVKIHVGLVGNPLDRDRAGSADLSVGLDANGRCWMQLANGLPLKQIGATPGLDEAFIGRPGPGDPLIVIEAKAGASSEAFAITNISNMMAFDCGDFDFTGPAAP